MPSSSSLSSTSLIGDYIGMESCIDVVKEGEEYCPEINTAHIDRFRCKRNQRLEMMNNKKAFPPAIPCRMPWVLKRQYTSDGRLILTEQKARHHEYFRAHRSNGRLTLQLVPIDDADDDVSDAPPLVDGVNDEDDSNNVDCSEEQYNVDDDVDNDEDDRGLIDGGDVVDDEERNENENNINEGMGGGKRLNYTSVSVRSGGSCSCIFGMAAVPAIKTVHS